VIQPLDIFEQLCAAGWSQLDAYLLCRWYAYLCDSVPKL